MSFYNYVNDKVIEGKIKYAEITKTLIYKSSPKLFDLLDFDNDDIFLEPLLFSYFNSNRITFPLSQILFGYISNENKPSSITLQTDENGVIYLPKIGYYLFNEVNMKVALHYKLEDNTITFKSGETIINYQFKELLIVPETDFEVSRTLPPLFNSLFTDGHRNEVKVAVEPVVKSHYNKLIKAFNILKENYPEYYDLIKSVVKRIVMYSSDVQRSFASVEANGTAFFNVKEEYDEVAILEDITHQCGHVIFYALSFDKEKYFKVDINTPLKKFTGNEYETRSVLGGFYALYPYCGSNMCSNLCFENKVFTDPRQVHEFMGRFAFRLKKFESDMINFNNREIFTEAGWEMFKKFETIFNEIFSKNISFLKSYNVAKQPYEFSYNIFNELNPIEEKMLSI